MIELLDGFPDGVVAFACRGHVTRGDYQTTLVPAAERALAAHGKVRIYYEIGPDFEGFEAGAMWEDFKVGVGHLSRWERVAVATDVEWIATALRMTGFLMPCEIRVFPLAEAAAARDWIAAA